LFRQVAVINRTWVSACVRAGKVVPTITHDLWPERHDKNRLPLPLYSDNTPNCSKMLSQTEELMLPLLRGKPYPAKPRRRTFQEQLQHNFDLSTTPSMTDNEIKASVGVICHPYRKMYKVKMVSEPNVTQQHCGNPGAILRKKNILVPVVPTVEVQQEKWSGLDKKYKEDSVPGLIIIQQPSPSPWG
jgi:hypothetical protein